MYRICDVKWKEKSKIIPSFLGCATGWMTIPFKRPKRNIREMRVIIC